MAIDYYGAALLLSARQRGIRIGRLLTLGRQHFAITADMARSLESQFDVSLAHLVAPEGAECFAEPFFDLIGAESVEAMDVVDYEGSSINHDLNEPIPVEWKNRYDFVIDGGTTEHVFNFPCAMKNAMQLVAPDGHLMGVNPADRWLGHGFYQFSPELFFRALSEENGFELIDALLVEYATGGAIYKVTDPATTGRRISLQSRRPVGSLILARKVRETAIFDSFPQQSDYESRWTGDSSSGNASGNSSPLRRIARKVLPRSIVAWLQERATGKKQAAESSSGLRRLNSLNEL